MNVETRGDGPAVVLIHGIPGSGAVWEPVATTLEATQRVVVPDLIGFGASPRARTIEDLDAEAQAAALTAALDAAGVEQAIFVGHDFGVPIALTLYARRPELVAGLVLVAGNAFTDTPIPLPIRAVTWPLVGRLAERALFSGPSLALMLRQGSSRPLDRARYLGDSGQQHAIRTIFAASLRELDARYALAERTLAQIDVPTAVACGDADPFFPVAEGERLAAAIPGARLSVLEGCGHFVPEERPDELARLVFETAPVAA